MIIEPVEERAWRSDRLAGKAQGSLREGAFRRIEMAPTTGRGGKDDAFCCFSHRW